MEQFSSMLGFLKEIAKLLSIIITHHHHPLPCLGISRDWMMGGAGSHGVVRAATTPLLDGWLDAWLDDIPPPPWGGGVSASQSSTNPFRGGVDIMHPSTNPSISSINTIHHTSQYQYKPHHPISTSPSCTP